MKEVYKTLQHYPEIKNFLVGDVIDIGCGDSPVLKDCDKFDKSNGDANYISNYVDKKYDAVFSSHCLEHMIDPKNAILEWWKIVKVGGYLIVTVPDEDLYEQGVFPSRYNRDHKWTFTIQKEKSWCNYSINVKDLLSSIPHAEIIKIQLQDNGYRHNVKNVDQTAVYGAMAQIMFILKKKEESKEIYEKKEICLTTLTDVAYAKKTEVMIESFLKYNKNFDVIVYTYGDVKFKNKNIKTRRFDLRPEFKRNGVSHFEEMEMARPLSHLELLKEYKEVFYCDGDLFFYDKIPTGFKNMAFTPHFIDGKKITDKQRYMIGGFINIGYYNLVDNQDTIEFLQFLNTVSQQRISGVNLNQKTNHYWQQTIYQYLPFLGYKYEFIENPCINVAYWNLEERNLKRKDGKYYIGENPLICYHFSGYENNKILSKHCKIPVPKELIPLYDDYNNRIK